MLTWRPYRIPVCAKGSGEEGIPTVDISRLFRDFDLVSIAILNGRCNREGYGMVTEDVAGLIVGMWRAGRCLAMDLCTLPLFGF